MTPPRHQALTCVLTSLVVSVLLGLHSFQTQQWVMEEETRLISPPTVEQLMIQDDATVLGTNSLTVSPAVRPQSQPEEQQEKEVEEEYEKEEEQGEEHEHEQDIAMEEEEEEEDEHDNNIEDEEDKEEETSIIQTISEQEETTRDDSGNSNVESFSPSSEMKTSSEYDGMEDNETPALETTVETNLSPPTIVPASPYTFLCDTAPPHAQPFEPIIMIANARTGSNLFFSFLGRLALFHMDLLPLYEIFGNDSRLLAQLLNHILQQIATGCQWEQDVSYNQTWTEPEQVFAAVTTSSSIDSSQQRILEELQHVFTHRLEDPAPFLEFLHRIPSTMPRAYYALKVFPFHVLDLMKMSVTDFLALFESMPKTQYILLWRRNMLEIFVSFQIALTRKGWVNVASTQDNAVQVDRNELEWFVQRLADFYHQAGNYLSTKSCHIFEYDQDLSNTTQQLNTVQRIQTEILQLPSNEEQVQMVVEKAGTTKQAIVPLSQQIVNWEEVQQWGYSESSLDWPNLFP
ncbi:hypothetical protein FisN_8Lh032 [Fistulifera solaris]|uniref:Sulfotransferase domain-containing protein n=1 Tax=Fistulifera solaris TaxID=1519565 RepID=A0A1Z5JD60_FISSO|nr:hypothetical protein FisN_8Lh032 [Fistulifera solaris]|eukprot:GAX11944.1 hypothetical protein FisN_8Lh032 [Fistulifera solaris]